MSLPRRPASRRNAPAQSSVSASLARLGPAESAVAAEIHVIGNRPPARGRNVSPGLLRALLLLVACILAGCATSGRRNPLATWVPSANFGVRRPMLIVIHYTEQRSVAESLDTLRDHNSDGPVSAHYLVGADGHIYQLVADDARAWHAGAGRWGTITDVNSASIGIELDNDGRSPFATAQIDALLVLLKDLTGRLHIPPQQVIGHEDLAPGRKVDPGPLFPWKRLADAGFGRWPSASAGDPPAGFDAWLGLSELGYALDHRAAAVVSFHHHFRGIEGGTLDAADRGILYRLESDAREFVIEAATPQ